MKALYFPFVALPELRGGNLHFVTLPALTRLSLWFPHKRSGSVDQFVLLFLFHVLKVCKRARTSNKFQWSETKPVCVWVYVCGGCGCGYVCVGVCVCVCVPVHVCVGGGGLDMCVWVCVHAHAYVCGCGYVCAGVCTCVHVSVCVCLCHGPSPWSHFQVVKLCMPCRLHCVAVSILCLVCIGQEKCWRVCVSDVRGVVLR